MAAFINGLKDQDLVKSLLHQPPEDFDNITNHVKTYVLTDKALHSSKEKGHVPSPKQENKFKKSKLGDKRLGR